MIKKCGICLPSGRATDFTCPDVSPQYTDKSSSDELDSKLSDGFQGFCFIIIKTTYSEQLFLYIKYYILEHFNDIVLTLEAGSLRPKFQGTSVTS